MSVELNAAKRLARLGARVFGGVVRKTTPQDYKVVKLFAQRPWQRDLPNWYPPIQQYNTLLLRLRHLGLYVDEHLDFQDAMDTQRRARGKGPTKKGEGKRATKKGGKKK